MEVFDIKRCVSEICMILYDKAEMKSIQFITKFTQFDSDNEQTKYFVKTDQKRLQQVLLNLLSNAIKYTDRNGDINIEII